MSTLDRPRGLLSIVSTPIGNLEDFSPRARRVLEEADRVACEDTRTSGLLLHRLGIKKRLVSLHEHNERQRLPQVLEWLEAGESVAVISDAGTPLLSDPGFLLVRAAAELGVRIEAVPGASAILTALVISGLPPLPFTFGGFPPPKSGKRRTFFRSFAALEHTLIFFESPHRLLVSLDDAFAELGERPAVVARELTKLYEEVLRLPLSKMRAELGARPTLKGEYVILLGKAQELDS